MARLFIDGFESGDLTLWDTYYGGSAVTPPSGMTGNYCLYFSCCGEKYVMKNLTPKTELYVALKYNPTDTGYSYGICGFNNGSTALARLNRNISTGLLEARRGTTLLATGSIPLTHGSTHLIEVRYVPHGTTGVFQVKVGGVMDIDFSGNTTPGATEIDGFYVGSVSNGGYPVGYFDDVVIDDAAWIGNTKIQGLFPTANGTTNDMTPSAGNNYECVDEKPASITDYVYSDISGHKELYVMGDLSGDIALIKCLTVNPYALGYGDPTPTQLKALVRVGSTNYQGDAKDVLTVTPKRSQHIWETNPATSAAWAASEVNALEAGVELV